MNSTENQTLAIESTARTTVIAAGPGSGKTTTLVARIARMIELGMKPEEIVVLTFTNAAARELEQRLGVKLGAAVKLGFIGTLHAFALRSLRGMAYVNGGRTLSLISPDAASDLLESSAKTSGSKASLKELLLLKRQGVKRVGRLTVDEVAVLSYFDRLRESDLLDLDELLPEFLRQIEGGKMLREYGALFVDECQDSAAIDWDIYHALPIWSKTFVGDPDQAIYGFRGGNVGGFLELAAKVPTRLIALEENFRSGEQIVKAAQRLIDHNADRIAKVTRWATDFLGDTVFQDPFPNEGAEVAHVAQAITEFFRDGTPVNEIAVLARTNAVAQEFARGLEGLKIPVQKKARYAVPRDWKLARAVIDMIGDPSNNTLAFFLLVELLVREGATVKAAKAAAHESLKEATASRRNLVEQHLILAGADGPPAQYAAQAAQACYGFNVSRESRMLVIEKIQDVGEGATLAELVLALAEIGETVDRTTAADGVQVMTIHAAKGREFDVVFLVGFEDEACPGNRPDVNLEEERRLAYVAITRARKYLSVSSAAFRRVEWGSGERTPSRFIAEMTGGAS
jgi:DNA helicase-2/ATP-dependent DNA helicase PcrA